MIIRTTLRLIQDAAQSLLIMPDPCCIKSVNDPLRQIYSHHDRFIRSLINDTSSGKAEEVFL